MASFSPQVVFVTLGANDMNRRGANRAMFRASLDQATIDDIRLALNDNQPLGNSRFMDKIARVTGERREARPRGRPSKDTAAVGSARG
jgi:putative transposase